MSVISRINDGALALRRVLLEQQYARSVVEQPEAFSKIAPYFGYVEVSVAGVDPFLMFSNNDDFVAQRYFWHGADAYEPMSVKTWAALSLRSATILDIGSYSGLYSLVAAKKNPKAKIYAFEALDRVFSRIVINKSVNRIGNLVIFNRAVSENEDHINLKVYSGDSILVTGSSILEKDISRPVFETKAVRCISIDSFMQSEHLGQIGLIKIDVEGAEHLVVRGGLSTLARYKPDILCELLRGAEVEAIERTLAPMGYRFFEIDDAAMEFREIEHLKPAGGMHNLNTLITQKKVSELRSLVEALDR